MHSSYPMNLLIKLRKSYIYFTYVHCSTEQQIHPDIQSYSFISSLLLFYLSLPLYFFLQLSVEVQSTYTGTLCYQSHYITSCDRRRIPKQKLIHEQHTIQTEIEHFMLIACSLFPSHHYRITFYVSLISTFT
jgi:hypothetical protein